MGVDSHGNAVPLEGFSPDEYSDPRLSPDGSRALVLCGSDVWILDLDRGTRRQITSDANSGVPGWSRNGDHALYVKGQSGLVSSLWRQAVRGSGIAEPIPIDADIGAWDLSPDERSVAFGERQFGTSIVVWSEDTGQVVLEESSATEAAPCFDPSGRLLTYVSNATGALEVYVRELETGETWRISREGGKEPVWSRDGRTLFYRDEGEMWSVTVGGASTFAPSEPILLFDEPYAVRPDNPAGASAAYDVTADGRFLMVRDLVPPTTEVRIVTGFHQQLERVAPIK